MYVEPRLLAARRWTLSGRVQGVGFRPFVYGLAVEHILTGWVMNCTGLVEIHAQGAVVALDSFGNALIKRAPPLARPTIQACCAADWEDLNDFSIHASTAIGPAHIHVPPDYFACDECVAELFDPADRRYRYPFINCTQCGPRYTLIERLPYDRPHTTMAGFPLCPACRAQYLDPSDRRFHAQPLACPVCGPQLRFQLVGQPLIEGSEPALTACLTALRAGVVVAVKGVGGYHLVCDATNNAAVTRLRDHKPRPHKPLAVMVAQRGKDGLDEVRRVANPRPAELALLADPMRPIVLVRKRHQDDGSLPTESDTLAVGIAPGLAEIGVMLPYSPLHHLLLRELGRPIVATSANLSGEPVLTDDAEVEVRLGRVAEAFLHHNRPIRRPADDAVWRYSAGKLRPLRLGRGGAPLELRLPFRFVEPLLAVGAQLKTTLTLAWDNRVVISPHIGGLGTPRGQAVFEQVADDLQNLYGIRAARLVCDAHPDYSNTRWARRTGLPVTAVYHHHAHAGAVVGEMLLLGDGDDSGGVAGGASGVSELPLLVFTWDGTGLGPDGIIWGGEALLGCPGNWQRVGTMRPFRLPGGDRVGREPWRAAAALAWEIGVPETGSRFIPPMLVRQAWERGIHCPRSSAVGRIFDAAATLTGLLTHASFEGQGPMYLEALCTEPGRALDLPLRQDHSTRGKTAGDERGLWVTDWTPLVSHLQNNTLTPAQRAADLHATLAQALLAQSLQIRADYGVTWVGLGGGVFQNRVLTETIMELLMEQGFSVIIPERLPVNDAAISFGQVIEAGGGTGLFMENN
ncbi:Carbamoyltransferase HypF [Gammaproteobacteria bacterium]